MSNTYRALLLTAFLLTPLLPSCAEHTGTNPARVAKNPASPGDDGQIFKPRPTAPVETNTGEGGGGGTPIGGGGNRGGGGGGGAPGGGPVPEPMTMLLVGGGLAGAALLRRKRAAAKKS